ncbi:MAG: hypothetical protein AAGG38_04655 [Planctomycetota bacterium]
MTTTPPPPRRGESWWVVTGLVAGVMFFAIAGMLAVVLWVVSGHTPAATAG